MAIWEVYAPSGLCADPKSTRLVRQGFSRRAFLLGPIWLLSRGHWIALSAWLICAGAAWLAFARGHLPQGALLFLYELAAVFIGFEAAALDGAKCERRGDQLVDLAVGDDEAEAELRHFARIVDRSNARESVRAPAKSIDFPGRGEDVIGLFPRSPGR